jgi:hypothetical protein
MRAIAAAVTVVGTAGVPMTRSSASTDEEVAHEQT